MYEDLSSIGKKFKHLTLSIKKLFLSLFNMIRIILLSILIINIIFYIFKEMNEIF